MLRITGPLWVTSGLPSQMASNAESLSKSVFMLLDLIRGLYQLWQHKTDYVLQNKW